jgi:hypothetical protein
MEKNKLSNFILFRSLNNKQTKKLRIGNEAFWVELLPVERVLFLVIVLVFCMIKIQSICVCC